MKNRGMSFQEIVYFVIVTLFWFAQYIYIPFQVVYLSQNGVSNYFLGTIVGAYGISQMLLRYPAGLYADCVGSHKRFIALGCFASGIASFFRVFLNDGFGFLLGNILSGIASAMWISFMIYYLENHKAESSQVVTSRIIMFNNVGMLIGFIMSMLLYSKIDMKGLCLLSFIGGILAWLFSFFLYEAPRKQVCNNLRELSKVCKDKKLIFFSILALLQQGIQMTTVMSFTSNILKNLNASNEMIGLSSVIYMCSAVVFSAIGSTNICRKKSSQFWISLTFLIVAIYNILIPNVGKIELVFLLQVLPGISTGILFSYLTSEALENIESLKKSTAMGFFQGVYAIGMTVFPIMIGKITSIYNLKTGYYILALVAVLGGIINFYYYKKLKKTGSIIKSQIKI